PHNSDRELNARDPYVVAAADDRSPWILFSDVADLKERVSYKVYRQVFRVAKDTELSDPRKVQEFIDNEHAETTYDPKYQGVYDGRPLRPGEIAELNDLIRSSPWNDDRLAKVYEKLYDGVGRRVEDYQDLRKEKATLENTPGKPSPRLKRKIDELDQQL